MDANYKSLEQLSHPLFNNLDASELQEIVATAKIKLYKKGEVLIHEGDVDSLVYVILDGLVSVTRKDETLQKVLNLATLGPKHVVGEISVITKMQKSATVTALYDTETLVIDFAKLALLPAEKQFIYEKLLDNLATEMARKLVYSEPLAVKPEEHIFDDKYTHIPNTILLLFGWKWKDIINEIPYLAEHGFDAIKLYPPQETAVLPGRPWYELYQPVTYQLSSFFGTEEEFRILIDICHTYNIKVYADLVLNHMAEYPLNSNEEHVGTNGHKFSKYHYGPLNKDGDVYEYDDFYHFGSEGNKQIQIDDYSTFDKSWRVEHFDLNYLPKLNFDNPHVIETTRKYINYLLEFGIDGFRVDAAKHISTDALAKILWGLKTKNKSNPFIYLEFYAGFPMGIDPYSYMEKFFKLGYVTSFSYGEFLADAIGGKNNNLEKLVHYSFGSSWVLYPENRAVTVLDNHDTERMMPHMLSYKNSHNNAYVLGYIFMLAWPFGVPKIMSSYYFSGFNDPIPQAAVWQDGRNTCFDSGCPWVCQHRWRAISNMVLFRKKMQDAKGITHVWANNNQVAFARTYQKSKEYVATKGFVVINNSGEKLQRKFETGLPGGIYFDLINSDLVKGKMQGPSVLVENYGTAEITVKPYDAVVLCVGFTKD